MSFAAQSGAGRTFEGMGIGLALVQELVKLHGGAVRSHRAQLGLTWSYTEEELRAAGAAGIDDANLLTPPSQAELAVLFELATIGDLLGLQARAAQLAQFELLPEQRDAHRRMKPVQNVLGKQAEAPKRTEALVPSGGVGDTAL